LVLLSNPPIPGDPWYLKPILVSIVAAIPIAQLLALPGRVAIDSFRIRQRYWWRSEKCITWSDLASVIHNQNDGATIVYGKFSSPIVFSPYLVNQSRFDREVKAFSRTDEIPDDV